MAMKPRTVAAAPKPAAATPPSEPETGVINVTVGRKFTIKPAAGAEYESLSVNAQVTASTYEEATAQLDEIMLAEVEKANGQFAEISASANAIADEIVAGAEGGGEGEELTADDIRAMKRSELVALIKEHELGIDPKGVSESDLREAVIEAAGLDEAAGNAAAGGGDDAEITPEEIRAMKRDELLELNTQYDLGLEASDFAKTPKGLSDLREAIIEAAGLEAEEEQAAADGDAEAYTEADLKEASVDDLKAIYAEWELGEFPKGPPVKVKNTAIKAILAAQDAAS